jgi:hypothetical protein
MPHNQEPVGQIGCIMKADYGDMHQAVANAARADPARSKQLLQNYKSKHEGHARDKVGTAEFVQIFHSESH